MCAMCTNITLLLFFIIIIITPPPPSRRLVSAVINIKAALQQIDEIVLLGNAPVMIVCFGASPGSGINTYSIADFMTKRGWSLNVLQNPACVHLCVTVRHVGREQVFIDDLHESVMACQDALARGEKLGGKAAIYGMASGMPSGPIEELLKLYNDVVLKT
jgi:sphinganine-1-phosphate aldolase